MRLRLGAVVVNEKTTGWRTSRHTITHCRTELYEMRTKHLTHYFVALSFQIPLSMSDAYTVPLRYWTPQT